MDVGFDGYAVSPGAGKYFIREISTSHGHRHPGDPIQSLMTWTRVDVLCEVKTFYVGHRTHWVGRIPLEPTKGPGWLRWRLGTLFEKFDQP